MQSFESKLQFCITPRVLLYFKKFYLINNLFRDIVENFDKYISKVGLQDRCSWVIPEIGFAQTVSYVPHTAVKKSEKYSSFVKFT